MKLNAEHHGSIIEMDTTCKVNDCRMSLVSAVIKDGNGHGQVNAQCLVQNENVETISVFQLSCDFSSYIS